MFLDRAFLVDTGCPYDLIQRDRLQEIDKQDIYHSEKGVCLATANGELECADVVDVQIGPLKRGNDTVRPCSTPDVLTVGTDVLRKGCVYWNPYSLHPTLFDRTESRFP